MAAFNCMGAQAREKFAKATRWSGMISGVLTLILSCFVLPSSGATLYIPSDFLSDVNKTTWRLPVFSFTPDTFIDVWTPFVMGVISVLSHFSSFRFSFMSLSFLRFGLWHLLVALFGNLGYCGGMGIIVGAASLVSSVLGFCAALVHEGPAYMQVQLGKQVGVVPTEPHDVYPTQPNVLGAQSMDRFGSEHPNGMMGGGIFGHARFQDYDQEKEGEADADEENGKEAEPQGQGHTSYFHMQQQEREEEQNAYNVDQLNFPARLI
eukprot:GHVT01081785.1.p1 GENE.GHVT01081785.1~~GHVT01081785.1.p1  ORF type:complete len:264 (-),score=28.82 GHVT01081785.1:217-1008(-)